jgi:hypothetical protein
VFRDRRVKEKRLIYSDRIRGKEQENIKGKCLQTIGLRREELYIQRQNDMRKAASKSNAKFKERGLRRESHIFRHIIISLKEQARIMGKCLQKQRLRREE